MPICWSFSRSKPLITIAPEFGKPLENHWFQWLIFTKTFNGDGPGMVKPLKNHWFQWLIFTKTFNGDGPGMVKPLKNHWWQWCLGKKTLPSHHYKKMTIVEAKCQSFQECHRHRTPFAIHAMFFFYLQWCSDEAVFFLRWFFQVDTRILWLEGDLKQI